MKKFLPLIALLAALSSVSGVLLSKMSFLARTAMNVFKKKYYYYSFMKIWWQGALFTFLFLLLLLGLQVFLQKRLSKHKASLLHLFCLFLAILGLYFTYADFRSNLSHRWAGERLHLGFYLFWIGWICSSLFLLWDNTKRITTSIDKTGATNL
jgi:uncharacterized membrane protein YozB (DUF420 family)